MLPELSGCAADLSILERILLKLHFQLDLADVHFQLDLADVHFSA